MQSNADVLILGAGMAGLAAARALAERGKRVLVLEARDRVGGRVFSERTPQGVIVEHGAEFIHGRSPVLWSLLEESGAITTERDGSMLRETHDGQLTGDPEHDEASSPLEELKNYTGPDMPFAQWLAQSDVHADERTAALGYVEGFNAADANRIGIRALAAQQAAEDAIDADCIWHVQGGYMQLADYLASQLAKLGGEIRLGCRVRSVRWHPGAVEVATEDGVFHAPKCVVTLPLGVLQSTDDSTRIIFEPQPSALAAAQKLAMGNVVRFTLVFRERWWERSHAFDQQKLKTMSFLSTNSRMPPVWWTRHPEHETIPTLIGWAGGPRSKSLMGITAEQLGQIASENLAAVFGMEAASVRDALVATYTHDWASDPFALGAYSYVPAGALDAPAAMTQPEHNTLYFAGEHTDITGNWGTVHAALGSGLRAARQILGDH